MKFGVRVALLTFTRTQGSDRECPFHQEECSWKISESNPPNKSHHHHHHHHQEIKTIRITILINKTLLTALKIRKHYAYRYIYIYIYIYKDILTGVCIWQEIDNKPACLIPNPLLFKKTADCFFFGGFLSFSWQSRSNVT